MAAMNRAGMKRFHLKEEGFEIELEKEAMPGSFHYVERPPAETHLHSLPSLPAGNNSPREKAAEGRFITSPIVGTFYSAPTPTDNPYIKVGDDVEEGNVVCIIEAMKVMNEVKAGLSGKVAEILVKNGDPVEFGTKLMRLV